jgi:hypothetical protein
MVGAGDGDWLFAVARLCTSPQVNPRSHAADIELSHFIPPTATASHERCDENSAPK